jgi:hypothetical protein
MDDELKQHVRDSNAWTRLLFMLLFTVLYGVAEMVLTAVVIFQFLVVLFTGGRNARVLSLGGSLSTYAYQVFRYLTYNSEERPFPFADWPSDRPLVEQAETTKPKRSAPRRRAAKPKPESEEAKPEQ